MALSRILPTVLLVVAAPIACSRQTVLAPDGICIAPVCATATRLCTTSTCAVEPCTAGCVFYNPRGADCPSRFAVTVEPKAVTSCDGFCGFAYPRWSDPVTASDPTEPGSCFHYDAHAPGCADIPDCAGYNQACWITDVGFSADGAAICPPRSICHDGSYVVEDSAQPNTCIDLAEAHD